LRQRMSLKLALEGLPRMPLLTSGLGSKPGLTLILLEDRVLPKADVAPSRSTLFFLVGMVGQRIGQAAPLRGRMSLQQMRRRAFLAGLAAWPLVARAEQRAEKVWRVGYLSPGTSASNAAGVIMSEAFRIKLQDLGYIEGKNLKFDVRRAEQDYTRLPGLAAELVSLAPDVIVGSFDPATAALQRATSSIPIVMVSVADPIGSGFVKSLAKPGGNITGLSNQNLDMTAKTLEILHAAVPNAKRIAVLMSPTISHQTMIQEAYAAAGMLGLTIVPVMARTPDDWEDAFERMHKENCDALVVLSDPRQVRKLVELTTAWRLPAIYQQAGFVDMGGLLSYSGATPEMFKQAAIYVDKILRGARPADLPVEQPTRVELEVNLKTAKTLGLTIPDSVLARADKVIE
jgi:putative tryptophan/tyrosine transport system substrate-binding protein